MTEEIIFHPRPAMDLRTLEEAGALSRAVPVDGGDRRLLAGHVSAGRPVIHAARSGAVRHDAQTAGARARDDALLAQRRGRCCDVQGGRGSLPAVRQIQ